MKRAEGRHLRAVFRFRTLDDPKHFRPVIKILRGTLRALRVYDSYAELRISDDDGPPVHFDADGD